MKADVVHVMNRGARRRRIFEDENDRHTFLDRIDSMHERYGTSVLAFCLLSNHYHLVLRQPGGDISAPMQLLSSQYTRYYNRRHGLDGPLFKGRFTSVPIRDDRQLVAAVRYVHANIFDIGPHVSPRTHPWSSHPTYLGRVDAPRWLDTDLVLGVLQSPAALDRLVHQADAA